MAGYKGLRGSGLRTGQDIVCGCDLILHTSVCIDAEEDGGPGHRTSVECSMKCAPQVIHVASPVWRPRCRLHCAVPAVAPPLKHGEASVWLEGVHPALLLGYDSCTMVCPAPFRRVTGLGRVRTGHSERPSLIIPPSWMTFQCVRPDHVLLHRTSAQVRGPTPHLARTGMPFPAPLPRPSHRNQDQDPDVSSKRTA